MLTPLQQIQAEEGVLIAQRVKEYKTVLFHYRKKLNTKNVSLNDFRIYKKDLGNHLTQFSGADEELQDSFIHNAQTGTSPTIESFKEKRNSFYKEVKELISLFNEGVELRKGQEEQKEAVPEQKINPYPHIFRTRAAYELFEYMKVDIIKKKDDHTGYSFIYRALHDNNKDHYIFETVGNSDFQTFLRNFDYCDIGKLSTWDKVRTHEKEKVFSRAEKLYKKIHEKQLEVLNNARISKGSRNQNKE